MQIGAGYARVAPPVPEALPPGWHEFNYSGRSDYLSAMRSHTSGRDGGVSPQFMWSANVFGAVAAAPAFAPAPPFGAPPSANVFGAVAAAPAFAPAPPFGAPPSANVFGAVAAAPAPAPAPAPPFGAPLQGPKSKK